MVKTKIEGILAEFTNPAELLKAAKDMRDKGYKNFDCHSPFPIHGMDDAMGEKRSPLGWIVGIVGITGFILAYAFVGWTSAIDYPLVISSKPFFSYQAYGPIGFAVLVLLGAGTALFGMLALNKLPRFNHPVFHSDHFSKVTDDGFFVSIEADDSKFNEEDTKKFLETIGAKNIELLVDQTQAEG